MTKRNPQEPAASGHRARGFEREAGAASPGLERIRQAAGRNRSERFTALLHHVTVAMLRDAFRALKRTACPGVDDVTWRQYEKDQEGHLLDLHARVQRGTYRAQPSKRVYLPKPDGRQRPIGIAAIEDKIVQKAVAMVLERIWEEDFAPFSYGFRPGRSQHDALDALWVAITQRKVNWVLDADIRRFFDTLDHKSLLWLVRQRVADKRVLRLIEQWLRAGVMEDGRWTPGEEGTPQGAVISPLLANVYLHYALDEWVRQRRQAARGEVIIVRYADDFVMGFQYKEDAEAFRRELTERLAMFHLELHPEKTRLFRFGRFAARDQAASRHGGKPRTLDFLGFTHICSTRRSDGQFTIRRQPITKRMRAKLKAIKEELMRRRHDPVPDQGRWLRSVVNGYFQYFAVPGAGPVLNVFRSQVCRLWKRALQRRSQKGDRLTWERMKRGIAAWIPSVRILHEYPNQRLTVNTLKVRAV